MQRKLFPTDGEEVPSEDIIPGPRGFNVRGCLECGAAVMKSKLVLHTEWHEKMDELIEWAQHISKLFTSAKPPEKFGMVMLDIYPQDKRCEKCDKFMIYDDHREQWVHTHSHRADCKGGNPLGTTPSTEL